MRRSMARSIRRITDSRSQFTQNGLLRAKATRWFIRVIGTKRSMSYSTKYPKTLKVMEYEEGGPQAWQHIDLGYESAYPTITGSIFEFGFTDSILQMWAAFCDELTNGREKMKQPFYCVTPEETHQSHLIFTQALESYGNRSIVR